MSSPNGSSEGSSPIKKPRTDTEEFWGRMREMIKEENLYFIETPLPIEDLEGCSKLAQSTNIRIATGEMLQTRFECFETIDKGRVDVIQPDVGRVGGLTEAKRVCEWVSMHSINIC